MREILFRGKRIDNGEWVEGYIGKYFDGFKTATCISRPTRETIAGSLCYDVDPITVGQFTGLTDKNAKKIFEGDVCNGENFLHPSRKRYQVGFEDGMFGLYDDSGTSWHHSHIDNVKVVGTIYDNPELMEGNWDE